MTLKKTAYIFIMVSMVMALQAGLPHAAAPRKTHTVFFQGQENELHVYRVNGANPGKTLLIIGGIQGDEPGGFLAADLYVDFSLKKGNLIVVPRANFPSILKRERQINQDMNRKFINDNAPNYETEVVEVLKKLICQSDCFLNLHEGSGIYSPTWDSQMKNPKRYGQSIIADTAFLDTRGESGVIDMEKMARQVIDIINLQITDPEYRFNFNNHLTGTEESLHKEQRASATYYAIQQCRIPAFGIESTRSLPLEQKIRQHIWAINAFMQILDIVPETPGIDLNTPALEFMIISVNDSIPVVVGNMQRLTIQPGDTIEVHDIITNYERGLSVNVIGAGNGFNDMKKKLVVRESTRIVAKKDFYECGSVFLDIGARRSHQTDHLKVTRSKAGPGDIKYKFKINEKTVIVDNYATVTLTAGDRLIIEDVISGSVDPSRYVVNFKGFVGNKSHNSGEDRGYVIDTGKDVLMKKYALDDRGRKYYVLITLDGKEVGKVFVDIQS